MPVSELQPPIFPCTSAHHVSGGAGSQPSSPTKLTATRSSLFKALFDVLPLDSLPRVRSRARRRDTSEGIIAPRSPSAQPPSPGLGPIPALNGMPSPLLGPRRLSSDAHRPGSPTNLSLSTPPRRTASDESNRDGPGGRRMGMRRAVSAQSTNTSGEGWREF